MMCGYNKKKIWAGVMGVEYPPNARVQKGETVMKEYSNQPGFISILDFIETPLHAKDKLTELCALSNEPAAAASLSEQSIKLLHS